MDQIRQENSAEHPEILISSRILLSYSRMHQYIPNLQNGEKRMVPQFRNSYSLRNLAQPTRSCVGNIVV